MIWPTLGQCAGCTLMPPLGDQTLHSYPGTRHPPHPNPATQRLTEFEVVQNVTSQAGHLLVDHVQMMIPLPPKYPVWQMAGFIKARSRSIWRGCKENGSRTTLGKASVRGCFVATVSRDEATIQELSVITGRKIAAGPDQ